MNLFVSYTFVLTEFPSFAGIRARHQEELENLTLVTQPFKTSRLFFLAVIQYLCKSVAYLLAHGAWFMLLSAILVLAMVFLVTIDGPHGKVMRSVIFLFTLFEQTKNFFSD